MPYLKKGTGKPLVILHHSISNHGWLPLHDRLAEGFTVADFRDAFGLTRRQAVPLLEWLDGAGWTTRRGDGRVVRKRSG